MYRVKVYCAGLSEPILSPPLDTREQARAWVDRVQAQGGLVRMTGLPAGCLERHVPASAIHYADIEVA